MTKNRSNRIILITIDLYWFVVAMMSLPKSVEKNHSPSLLRDNLPASSRIVKSLSQGEQRITTICMNLDDGVGDAVSQAVLAKEHFDQRFADMPNVKMTHICICSEEKKSAIEFLFAQYFPEEIIGIFDPDLAPEILEKRLENSKIILINLTKFPQADTNTTLQDFLLKTDFLLNISLELQTSDSNLYLHNDSVSSIGGFKFRVNKGCYIQSLLEYKYTDTIELPIENYKEFLFQQSSMGYLKGTRGIRFLKPVHEAVNTNKLTLFQSFSPQVMHHFLPPEANREEQSNYLQSSIFAAGYIKNPGVARRFLLMAIETTDKTKDVNLLMDAGLFNDTPENANFFDFLKGLGFSHFEVIRNQEKTLRLLTESSEPKRIVRIFDFNFKDISQKDKDCFFGLAELIGGSGDNSVSEVITAGLCEDDSCRALPFFDPPAGKLGLLESLKQAITAFEEETQSDHALLKQYLDELYLHKQYSFFKKNRKELIKSWGAFCVFLHKNFNVERVIQEFIVGYAFHNLLKNNRLDTLIDLARDTGPQFLKGETLLHLAIKSQNAEAVRVILERKLCDVTHYPVNQNFLNPLYIALHQGNWEIFQLLLPYVKFEDINFSYVLKEIMRNDNPLFLKYFLSIPHTKIDFETFRLLRFRMGDESCRDYFKLNGLINLWEWASSPTDFDLDMLAFIKSNVSSEDWSSFAQTFPADALVNCSLYNEVCAGITLVPELKKWLLNLKYTDIAVTRNKLKIMKLLVTGISELENQKEALSLFSELIHRPEIDLTVLSQLLHLLSMHIPIDKLLKLITISLGEHVSIVLENFFPLTKESEAQMMLALIYGVQDFNINVDCFMQTFSNFLNDDIERTSKEALRMIAYKGQQIFNERAIFQEFSKDEAQDHMLLVRQCIGELAEKSDWENRLIFFNSREDKNRQVPYKGNKYASVAEYRKTKDYPSKSLDLRPEAFGFKDLRVHGTSLLSVLSAIMHSNKQLVPGIKLRKLLGSGSTSGESQGIVDYQHSHISNKYVSSVLLNQRTLENLAIPIGYSCLMASPEQSFSSHCPVLVLGDGAGKCLALSDSEHNEVADQRINIRILVAQTSEDKQVILDILSHLKIEDIKVCTLQTLYQCFSEAELSMESCVENVWNKAEGILPADGLSSDMYLK